MKADASRDYYADLELSPDCTEDDIKKQYKKLALLYHPDRNRGNEAECSIRFQAIQAAHEVLGDPEQRTKYDQARRRGSVHTTFDKPAGPRGRAPPRKPPPDASNFPPPPRRTGPTRTDVPPSGADRYQNFAPPPRREATGAKSDAKDRANMFTAWKHMNSHQKVPPQTRQSPAQSVPRTAAPPPPPRFKSGQSPQEAYNSNAPPRQDNPAGRSAYEQMNRQRPTPSRNPSSFEATRKTGYDPHSRGDENPVTNPTLYNSSERFDRSNRPRMSNGFPSPHPAPTAKKHDTAQTPYTEGPRERAPYATNVFERTHLASEGMQRSASTKESPQRRTAETSNRGVSFQEPSFKSRRYSSSPPRKPTMEDQSAAKSAPHTPSGHSSDRPSSKDGFFVYSSADESEGSASPPSGDFESARRRSSQGTGVSASSNGSNAAQASHRPKAQPSTSWTNRSAQNSNSSKSMDEPDGPSLPRKHPTFSTPERMDMHARSSNPEMRGRKSEDSINNRFTGRDIPQSISNNNMSPNGYLQRTESHPDILHRPTQQFQPANSASASFFATSPSSAMPPPPRSAPGAPEGAPLSGSGSGTGFPADRWARAVQEENWASRWANPPTSGTSPTRANSTRHRTSRSSYPLKASTFPSTIVADEDDAEAGLAGPSPLTDGGDASYLDEDAMDIDEENVSPHDTRGSSSISNSETPRAGVRHVFVEPSRPEWRDDFGSAPEGLQPPPNVERRHSHPNNTTTPQAPLPQQRPASQISMDDFRHIPPLSGGSNGAGLGNMNEMKSDLPFKSQPSDMHPTRARGTSDVTNVNSDLPKPPRAPLPPSKHSKTMWETYLRELREYFHAWNSFNTTMVALLGAKAAEFSEMEKGPEGGMVDDWLAAAGETESLGGWETYKKKLREEEKCRVYWNVATERHRDAVQRHERLRRLIMKEGFKD